MNFPNFQIQITGMNGFEIFPFLSFLILIFMISGRVVFLKQKGVKISSTRRKTVKTALFIYPFFLVIMLLWLWEIAKPALQISFSALPETVTRQLIQSDLIRVTGIVIISISLVVMLFTLLHFRNSLRFGLDENNPGKLIKTGVFAVSRNPFFLSLDLYFLGIAILLPCLFYIGFAVLTCVGIHFFILKEEKFMTKIYGSEYLEYYRKVRRYL
jgi:protein-S-isoprenylcysteine O-methyltransferase Ste14